MAYNLENGTPSFVIEVDFLKGAKGDTGFSPKIEIASLTSAEYILKITTADGEFYTPNLKSDLSLEDYVKKEPGKDLSTNDYTDDEKLKLQELHSYDDTDLRNQVSSLAEAIGDINSFEVKVVEELPSENIDIHTIYFVPNEQDEKNYYDEYLYVDNKWEHIGTSEVDLSNHVTKDYLQQELNKKMYYFNNVEEMKSCSTLIEGDACQTLGYYGKNDGGGANYLIRAKLDTDIEDNGSIHFINDTLVAELISENELNVKQFGAKGDNTNDDTVSIQNTINYSCNNACQKIFIPKGTYKITNNITTKAAFNQPIIEGENSKTTIFDYSSIENITCLTIKGGSGQVCLSCLKNITFKGNETSIAVELQAVGGYKIEYCNFGLNSIGVLFHNKSAGEFTECNIVEFCHFTTSCSVAVKYQITAGTESFNGSGIKNCYINQSSIESNEKIVIGENCLVYNAPLDFEIWLNNSSASIIKNLSTKQGSFYGNIRIENHSTMSYFVNQEHYGINLVGDVILLGGNVSYNKVKFYEKLHINSDRSITKIEKTNIQYININEASTNITNTIESGETWIIDIMLHGANYEYHHTLLVSGLQASNTISITELANSESFNTSGWGKPTFSANGRILSITNANFVDKNIHCYVAKTQLSGRMTYGFR